MRTTGLIQFFSKGRLGLFDLGGKGDRGREGKDQNEEPFLKLVTPLPSSFSPPLLLLFSFGGNASVWHVCAQGGQSGLYREARMPPLLFYVITRTHAHGFPQKFMEKKYAFFWRFYEGKRSYILFFFWDVSVSRRKIRPHDRDEKEKEGKKLFFPSSPLISPFPILLSRQKPKCPFPKKEIKLKREGI